MGEGRNRPTHIKVEDDTVLVEWDVKLGRMKEGYPVGADYKHDTVRIDKYARNTAAREHLVHELLHKLWEKCGLDEAYSVPTEEYIITHLAGRLADLLLDNPELVAFLTED